MLNGGIENEKSKNAKRNTKKYLQRKQVIKRVQ